MAFAFMGFPFCESLPSCLLFYRLYQKPLECSHAGLMHFLQRSLILCVSLPRLGAL